jgi:hypothetical protein
VCYVILVRRSKNNVGTNVGVINREDGSGRELCSSGIEVQGSVSSDGVGQCFSKCVTPNCVKDKNSQKHN